MKMALYAFVYIQISSSITLFVENAEFIPECISEFLIEGQVSKGVWTYKYSQFYSFDQLFGLYANTMSFLLLSHCSMS